MKRRVMMGAMLSSGVAAALCLRPASAAPLAFHRGSWQALLAAHKGRQTIVHFWGLTCGPCLVELPEWGRFARDHPGADLVLVAADAVPQQPDAIAATLAKSGLPGVESWWFQDRFTERLFWEVSHDWQGELPYTVFLQPDGSSVDQTGAIEDFSRVTDWLRGAPFRRT